MDEPFTWVRAVHFAATICVTGAVFFQVFVAEPAFRMAGEGDFASTMRSRFAWIEWCSLALALFSGGAWLLLQAGQIGEMRWSETPSEGLVWMVLVGTDFGRAWIGRLLLAALLAAVLLDRRRAHHWSRSAAAFACVVAGSFSGTLAWAGHAAGTPGVLGAVHFVCDVLHLIAAAAWVGALVPLAILLGAAHGRADEPSAVIARDAVARFSMLGVVGVGILLATGIVNCWVLVGSIPALFESDYGRLVLGKVALFLIMLSLAAINRLRLTSQLMDRTNAEASWAALRGIRNNSVAEAMLGAVVVVIVGFLGTIPPGLAE